MRFAYFHGHIVTANKDGSIPLNAKVVAEIRDFDADLLAQLIGQANASADVAKRDDAKEG